MKIAVFFGRLGWSNPDTGPANMRLYATDMDDHPRWAKPRARVMEDSLLEHGVHEGARVIVVVLSREATDDDVNAVVRALA